jgi:hypothetical protein
MPYGSRDLFFSITGSTGTTHDISAHLTSVDGLPGEYALTDVTDVGDTGHRFAKGRFGAEFRLSGLYDKTVTTGLDTVMTGLLGMTTPSIITYGPTGASSYITPPNRLMSGGAFIRAYTTPGSVGAAVSFEAMGVLSRGSTIAGGLTVTVLPGGSFSTWPASTAPSTGEYGVLETNPGYLNVGANDAFYDNWTVLGEVYDPDSMFPGGGGIDGESIQLKAPGTYAVQWKSPGFIFFSSEEMHATLYITSTNGTALIEGPTQTFATNGTTSVLILTGYVTISSTTPTYNIKSRMIIGSAGVILRVNSSQDQTPSWRVGRVSS